MGKAISKAITYLAIICILSSLVIATEFEYRYSPYTSKLDRTRSTNQTGNNLTADNFYGNINSSNIINTPAQCPTGSYMVEYNGTHSICVSAIKTTGDNRMTGDYNFSNVLYVDDTNNDRVGIGTTTPNSKLDVNGTITFNGGSLAGGSLNSVVLSEDSGDIIFRGLNFDGYWVDSHVDSTAFQIGTGGGNPVFTGTGSEVPDRMMMNTEGLQIAPSRYDFGSGWPVPTGTFEVLGADNNIDFTVDVNGTVTATNNIVIGNESAPSGFNGLGDLFVLRNLKVMEGMFAEAQQYGAGLEISDNDLVTTYQNVQSANATINGTTKIIYDSEANFDSSYIGQFGRVISATGLPTGATGEMINLIDSTHIEVSFGSAGSDVIPDVTGMIYIIYPAPRLSILDGGDIHFRVGVNDEASFKISIPNGTNTHGVHIADVVGIDNHKALDIEQDFNGHSAIAQNIYMHSSKQLVNENLIGLLIEGDASNMNNSDGVFIDLNVIGTPLDSTNGHMDGIKMPTGLDHLIHVGSSDSITDVYDNDVNITANVTNGGTAEVFSADNDYLYIGADVNFTAASFSLDTPSNSNVLFLYYYCVENGDWNILPGVTDSTGGFTVSGGLSFSNPIDRGTCNEEVDGTPLSDTTERNYIALQRTRKNVNTPPILDKVAISGGTSSMFFNDDLLRLNPVDSAPETCDATVLGGIYFDISEDDMCICKAGGWFVMTDGSACT